MTAQLKTGSGTITRIDAALPFLEYEFSWNDKATGEKKTAKSPFMVFSTEAKEAIKTTPLKVGDIVSCEYEQVGWDKTLLKFGPKADKPAFGGFKGGSSGYKKDPVEEAKTRRSIERQKAADIVSRVYVACIDKSNEPVPKTFKEMMATIREEIVLLAEVLGEKE